MLPHWRSLRSYAKRCAKRLSGESEHRFQAIMKSPEVLVTVPSDLGFPFTMSIEKWNSGGLCSKPFKSGLGLHPGKRISAFWHQRLWVLELRHIQMHVSSLRFEGIGLP